MSGNSNGMNGKSGAALRQARLRQALRDNLRKRKAQQRADMGTDTGADESADRASAGREDGNGSDEQFG